MKKMKVWSTVLATGVALTTLAACSGGSNSTTASSSEEKADKSQELVIYSNSVSNGRGDWLTAKAKEAGFNIKMVDIAGAQLADRVIAEKNNAVADMVFGIGIVFQSYALFPTMTVFDNIAFGLKVKKVAPDVIKAKVSAVAAKIKISDQQLQRNVSELSGGQQQRVALARALVLEPKILCLDEPLSNLDAKLRVDLRKELKRLQKELGITTLYVTHDQEEALTLSDRIAVFNNGYIEQVGTPVEIYHNSQTEFVCDFIGDINVLTDETVHEVLLKNTSVFLEDKKGYIRLEKVRFNRETEQDFILKGTIIDVEFSGVTIHYTIKVSESQILNVTSIDSQAAIRSVGESVELFITPSDVLQF
ncbi:spermidine/putrescine import ATP-binding protein PotA [Streptococcus pneumoniae]|nr:spermidine/putrescine import ATP-binding protein PotA [Streptococcus pneumoniae]